MAAGRRFDALKKRSNGHWRACPGRGWTTHQAGRAHKDAVWLFEDGQRKKMHLIIPLDGIVRRVGIYLNIRPGRKG